MPKLIATVLLTLILAAGAGCEAMAHKVVAGAYASGDRIEGEIGFSDGSIAKNVLVQVLAADGSKLGETRTRNDGSFVFVPSRRAVHVFRADLGEGHVAEVRLELSDLPATLAAGKEDAMAAAAPAAAPAGPAPAAIGEAERAALMEAVRNEIRPLRREIIALKEKNDLQAILGGIGYIAGLFGLWFFLAARRRNKQAG